MSQRTRFDFFAACPPGLELITWAELCNLGLNRPQTVPGGVEFSGFLSHLYRINLWSRTASRVLVRLGEFEAKSFGELERKAAGLAWDAFLPRRAPVRVRATCHKSKLYHSDAVAERVAGVIAARLGAAPGSQDDESVQQVVARLDHDRCTLSLDSSGPHLHRRGYRLETAKAPLRETLAAALLLHARYDPARPFLDPACGSGTFAIEAALLARNLAPGRARRFAFMDWANFDEQAWAEVQASAQAGARPQAPAPILASDRDDGAVAAALANASRAGVADSIQLVQASLSAVQPPPGAGLLIANLPYGGRVGSGAAQDLRDLYAQFGNVVREKFTGWRVALLAGSLTQAKQTRLAWGEPLWIENGGLRVPFIIA
jgi:putative N6-adenine-specific DNA methylase